MLIECNLTVEPQLNHAKAFAMHIMHGVLKYKMYHSWVFFSFIRTRLKL